MNPLKFLLRFFEDKAHVCLRYGRLYRGSGQENCACAAVRMNDMREQVCSQDVQLNLLTGKIRGA